MRARARQRPWAASLTRQKARTGCSAWANARPLLAGELRFGAAIGGGFLVEATLPATAAVAR